MQAKTLAIPSALVLRLLGCGTSSAVADEDESGSMGTAVDDGASADDDDSGSSEAYTFHGDAEPILRKRCTPCHQPDSVGPFGLLDYEDAYDHRLSIAAAVEERLMPPLPPDDRECQPIADFRQMSDQEREVLRAWVDGGALRGDPAETPEPPPPDPDELGPPDAVFDSGVDYTFASTTSEDEYRCFWIDPQLTDWTWVRALWVASSAPNMVHHAVAWAVPASERAQLEMLDGQDPLPGWPCYGFPEFEGFGIGGYAPGGPPVAFPDGTSVPLEAGTLFAVEMHYYGLKAEQPNRMKLHMWTDEDGGSEYPRVLEAQTFDFFIPAGDESVVATTTAAVVPLDQQPIDASQTHPGLAWGASIHMHLLGKTGRLDIVHPDGSRDCVLNIPAWNDDWQGQYRFAEPLEVAAGDVLELRCEWDNGAEHQPVVMGEKQVPKDTWWGFGARDEMCVGSITLTDP